MSPPHAIQPLKYDNELRDTASFEPKMPQKVKQNGGAVQQKLPLNDVNIDQSFDKYHDKSNDDKDIVDFFQNKYLQSQEVESSNMNESMLQQNAIEDDNVQNGMVDQSVEHRRQFIDNVFSNMHDITGPENIKLEPNLAYSRSHKGFEKAKSPAEDTSK